MQSNLNIRSNSYHLEKLNNILNYEVSAVVLYTVSFALRFLEILLILAAMLFTPYMLFVLFKEKKASWIITFCIMVLAPFIWCIYNSLTNRDTFILSMVTLGTFYLYCFLLKLQTREWIATINARKALEEQRELNRMQNLIFQKQYDKIIPRDKKD